MFASEPRRGSTGLPLILLLLLLAAPLYGCSKSTKEESSARDTQSAQQPPAPTGQSAQQPPAPTSRSAEQTPAPKGQSAANLPDFAQAVARSQGPSKEAQEEAAAARTKEAQQKAQKVLERARAATHVTKEALEKIIVGRASGSGSDGSFKTDISSPPDGRFWYRRVLEGRKPFEALITTEGAWSVHEDGTRTPLSRRTTLMVRSHDFQRIAIDPESFAQNIGWVKETDFHTLKSQELLGYTEDGTKIYLYFDDKSGLPLGFRMDNPVQTDTSVTIIFQMWKNVEGVLLPSKVLALDAPRNFQLTFRGLFFQDEEK